MSKSIITMEDTGGGISVRVEFDPALDVGPGNSPAQWLAGEMLKLATAFLERCDSEGGAA